MRLIADVMGADASPEALVPAFVKGAREAGCELTLCGDADKIRAVLSEEDFKTVEVCHAESVVTMEDSAMSAVKKKKDSSMALALQLLKEGRGDAVISAGNTGALVTGASVIVGRLGGMKTAAIGTILPLSSPTLLMDAGASINILPENLVQFAHLGSAYMEALFDIKGARVGLINNGAEETKGTSLYREAHALLKAEENIHFVGNIEGRDVPFGRCDVLLCDGFTGNIVLKLSEGFGFYFSGILKQGLMESLRSKLGALLLKPQLKGLRRRLDYTEYGGAPILGIAAPVIKAHGASSPKAIVSAVKMAKRVVESDFFRRVTSVL